MSDSFADLWNPSTPQKKPQTLSSIAQQQSYTQHQGQPRPQGGKDLFALLSSASSSSTHTSSSNAARSSPSLRSSTPSSTLTSTPPPSQQQRQQQQRSTTDAFSDLFSSSASSSQQNLTIAQRTALADQQQKDVILGHQKQQEKEKSAWAGLDSLSVGGSVGLTPTALNGSKSTPVSAPKGLADDVDDWGLEDFGKLSMTASSQDKPNARPTAPANKLNTWDFDSFGKPTPGSNGKPTEPLGGGSLWDLDEFTSPSTDTQPRIQQTRVDSPSDDFDFGSREDGLLNSGGDNVEGLGGDEDFMGVFNKPPQPKQTTHQQPRSSSPAPSPTQNRNRVASPPPHILGQVVEMGFSIPKAKAALAANNNDVQAALDQLLASEGGYTGGSGAGGRGTPTRNSDSTVPAQAPPRRRDRDQEPPQRQRRGETSSPSASMPGNTDDIQAQAEQLLAQASVFSRGMFIKASTFLKEKKEQAQKAVEEYRTSSAASGGSGAGRSGGGRPKWMQQESEEGDVGDVVSLESSLRDEGGASREFRDEVGVGYGRREEREKESKPEVWIPKRPDRQREKERQRAREREAAAATPSPAVKEPEVDLFAPAPVESLSSTLRAPPSSAPPRQQPSSSTTRPRQQQSQKATLKYQRNTSAISSSIATLKSEANVSFKLGQFGNAETFYSRAIHSLRSSSSGKDNLYFVLLLNNRANARMKNGDISGAVKDCNGVVGLITTNHLSSDADFDTLGTNPTSSDQDKIDWDPAHDVNTKFAIPVSGASEEIVDLVDGLTKAIKRRAEAYEGLEKWNKAKNDWEVLRVCAWVRNETVRGEAGRGVGRCVRMNDGDSSRGTSAVNMTNGLSSSSAPNTRPPAPKSKPRPRPTPPTTANKPSSALNALRTTAAAAEAEDQAKHELKDSVDARLSNWKNGKENNIRALLASLDTILWDDLVKSGGAVKVGMHELVTPAQVKVKYMKAVAKVHPDKLNASNSTLEQRMIAQGVFAGLNEAWNAFKQ